MPRVDISSLAAAARSPDLAALEKQLEEAEAALLVVGRDRAIAQEDADPAFQNPLRVKNGATLSLAAEKVAGLSATANALEKTRSDLRRRIANLKPQSLAAVTTAIAPFRTQAANDIRLAVNALYEAFSRYNETSTALQQNGGRALMLPVRLDILDHFVIKASEG
jgi:hypothetical protein